MQVDPRRSQTGKTVMQVDPPLSPFRKDNNVKGHGTTKIQPDCSRDIGNPLLSTSVVLGATI
eukprot:15963827-Heterocapsa_arctica.AAC.1